MLTFITYYFIIGVLWTALADWFIRRYSSTKESFSFGESLLNIFFWWIAVYIVYKSYKQDDDE